MMYYEKFLKYYKSIFRFIKISEQDLYNFLSYIYYLLFLLFLGVVIFFLTHLRVLFIAYFEYLFFYYISYLIYFPIYLFFQIDETFRYKIKKQIFSSEFLENQKKVKTKPIIENYKITQDELVKFNSRTRIKTNFFFYIFSCLLIIYFSYRKISYGQSFKVTYIIIFFLFIIKLLIDKLQKSKDKKWKNYYTLKKYHDDLKEFHNYEEDKLYK